MKYCEIVKITINVLATLIRRRPAISRIFSASQFQEPMLRNLVEERRDDVKNSWSRMLACLFYQVTKPFNAAAENGPSWWNKQHWWLKNCFNFTEIARIITRKRLSNWDLQNTVTDLERRITEQEIYSSKDSSIIENSPTKDGIVSISEQVCFFFELRLGYKKFPGRFKAWHYLGTGDKTKPAPVFVKIILASIRVLG